MKQRIEKSNLRSSKTMGKDFKNNHSQVTKPAKPMPDPNLKYVLTVSSS